MSDKSLEIAEEFSKERDEDMLSAIVTRQPIFHTVKVNYDEENRDLSVEVHDKMLSAVTQGRRDWNTVFGSPVAKNRHLRELKDDIDVSKKIVEAIVEQENESKRLSETTYDVDALLKAACERELDCKNVFVNVSKEEKLDAIERIESVRAHHPDVNVVPVDAVKGFTDVNPLNEAYIPELKFIMHVQKHIDADDLLPEIRFAIPNKDFESVETAVKESNGMRYAVLPPDDLQFEIARYVHLDSMPVELTRVIRAYLCLRRGSFSKVDLDNFARTTRELCDSAQELANKNTLDHENASTECKGS